MLEGTFKQKVSPFSIAGKKKVGTLPFPFLLLISCLIYILDLDDCVRARYNQEHQMLIEHFDKVGHLSQVLESLNVLGSVGWRINQKVLSIVGGVWNSGLSFPGTDFFRLFFAFDGFEFLTHSPSPINPSHFFLLLLQEFLELKNHHFPRNPMD